MTTVGFVGLGAMGAPMAWNVHEAGFDLVVYNRTTARERPFANGDVSVTDSPKHLTSRVNVVCVMVSDGDALEEVLERDLGVLAGLTEETTVVQMSTVGRDETLAAAAAIEERGGQFVDCPVSGTVGPAEEGSLVGLAAGDRSVVEDVRPVLDAMCDPVVYCGPTGQGTSAKLFVNLLLGSAMAAFAEALVFGASQDIDVETMRTIVENGALAAPLFSAKGDAIAERDFTSRFPLKYQLKDLALAGQRASADGVPLHVGAAARELFTSARGQGFDDEDVTAVVKAIEETTGVEVGSADE